MVDCSVSISRVGNTVCAPFKIPKIGNVYACSYITTGHIIKQMPRGDSTHQIGLVRFRQRPAKCGGSISNVVNLAAAGSEILKIGNVCACPTRSTERMAKWMAPRDSAGQIDLIHNSQCVVDCSVSTSRVGNAPCAQFQIQKIGEVCACSTATSSRIAKWMAR